MAGTQQLRTQAHSLCRHQRPGMLPAQQRPARPASRPLHRRRVVLQAQPEEAEESELEKVRPMQPAEVKAPPGAATMAVRAQELDFEGLLPEEDWVVRCAARAHQGQPLRPVSIAGAPQVPGGRERLHQLQHQAGARRERRLCRAGGPRQAGKALHAAAAPSRLRALVPGLNAHAQEREQQQKASELLRKLGISEDMLQPRPPPPPAADE